MMRLTFIGVFIIVLNCLVSNVDGFSSTLRQHRVRSDLSMNAAHTKKNVLIIGGTRFSGLYLWKELHQRGHQITLFNRGKTAPKQIPNESTDEFNDRVSKTRYIQGNRQDSTDMTSKLQNEKFDVIYDMNGREVADTQPLADLFRGKIEQFIYMSSAGVYKKSSVMPHFENDAEDIKSRHKGKLETEKYLREAGIPFTSIRPTYIYGPLNYNPLEEYFFSRVSEDRTVCIPGHGQHVTGLGHVEDLAVAMAQVIGRDHTKGQIYNIQDIQSVTFEGLAKLCGQAAGVANTKIQLYDKSKFDFGEKKAFPMREQHFFCSGIVYSCTKSCF